MHKDSATPIYRDIIVQVGIVIALTLLIALWMANGQWGEVSNKPFSYLFLQGLVGILFIVLPPVYINIYGLVPHFLVKKRYAIFGTGIIVTTLVWGYFAGVLEPWTDENWFGDPPQKTNLAGGFIAVGIILVISTLSNIAYRWFIQSSRIKQMENDHLNMELSLLKNQINPHFFFNTLNNLYALSLENSKDTSQVILTLSDMMRYTIYDCKQPYVNIQQEVKYLENYMALEQIRHEDHQVSFQKSIVDSHIKIAPMILIVFVENAFKHGIGSMTDGGFIQIELKADNELIDFKINNSYKVRDQKTTGGLGLDNVKRRLSLMYGDKHRLIINKTETEFSISLQIEQ